MAISFFELTSGNSTDNVTSYQTASISPVNGKLYLIAVQVAGTNPVPDIAVTGLGVTWEPIIATAFVARGMKLFAAIGSPGTGVLTIASTTGVALTGAGWHVFRVDGADVSGATAAAAIRQTKQLRPISSGTPTGVSVAFDTPVLAGNGAFGVIGTSTAETITPGAGWTGVSPQTWLSPSNATIALTAASAPQNIAGTWTTPDTANVVGVEIKAAAAAVAPTVSAGADVSGHTVSTAFTRTATETDNGSAITARSWTIVSGPAGVGSTIGTAAALSWTPGTAGSYVLRYSATNAGGTATDDVAVTVVAASAGISKVYIGSSQVVKRYVGTQEITRKYIGTNLVWDSAGGGGGVTPPPPVSTSGGLLLSPSQIQALPTSGAGWTAIMDRVNTPYGGAYAMGIRDDSNKDVLAHALAGARLNNSTYKNFVRDKISLMMSKGRDINDVLSTLRNIQAYIISADLIDLKSYAPSVDSQFRTWLDNEIRFVYAGGGGGGSVIGTHDKKPNNFGTHAGAGRVAAALYLGDTTEYNKAVTVWRGWVEGISASTNYGGETRAWTGTNWQINGPTGTQYGINPQGASKDGHTFDGVIPEDQRRASEYDPATWPPISTNYIHGATDGMTLAFWMMGRQGQDCWNWANQAAKRQMVWKQTVAGSEPYSGFRWQVPVIEKIYGLSWADHDPAGTSTNFGYADWWAQ